MTNFVIELDDEGMKAAQEIEGWLTEWDWSAFLVAAAAVVPEIEAAYRVYLDQHGHFVSRGEEDRKPMTLGEFAAYSVYEWFK